MCVCECMRICLSEMRPYTQAQRAAVCGEAHLDKIPLRCRFFMDLRVSGVILGI